MDDVTRFYHPSTFGYVSSPIELAYQYLSLEVRPGPKSILGYLPSHLRRKVRRYAAFEPSDLFSTRVEKWLCSTSEVESPPPCLERPPEIHRFPFELNGNGKSGTGTRDALLYCILTSPATGPKLI